MKTVYCICGLGSDERIFSRLSWGDNIKVHYLNWLIPETNESLPGYAKRMSEQITDENPVLIGVSFGGIMSIEIAKIIAAEKVILISSVKSRYELPPWMKTSGKAKLDTLIPQGRLHSIRPLKLFSPIENYFLGVAGAAEKKLANEYRKNVHPYYLKWSIHQILNWKNEWLPPNLYHLHGTTDKIFPVSYVKPTHTLQSAGHFMVYQHFTKVSAILQEII